MQDMTYINLAEHKCYFLHRGLRSLLDTHTHTQLTLTRITLTNLSDILLCTHNKRKRRNSQTKRKGIETRVEYAICIGL